MAVATTTAILAAAAAGAAASVYSANKQAKAQERAGAQAADAAKKQAAQAEEQMNRQNARRPDTNAMLAANQQAGMAGNAGTMLTGPMGVDPGTLQIGRNTLLGG